MGYGIDGDDLDDNHEIHTRQKEDSEIRESEDMNNREQGFNQNDGIDTKGKDSYWRKH